jgi:hypothetical protein
MKGMEDRLHGEMKGMEDRVHLRRPTAPAKLARRPRSRRRPPR